MNELGVVLFHTSSSALRAEKTLLRAKIDVKLIPTPRQFSSDCNLAIRFDWRQAEQIKTLLDKAQVEIEAIRKM